MDFALKPVWPWPTVLLVALGLLAVVLWTYPPRVRHLPRPARVGLVGLRLLAVLLLVLAMLRPELQTKEGDDRKALLYLLTDASRSMNTPDGPGGVSRRAALVRLLEEHAGLLERLGETFEIRRYEFDSELKPVDEFGASADGDQTAIGAALGQLAREAGGGRSATVLMMSDFAQRARPPVDDDPRAQARLLGQGGVHVNPVIFGGTGLQGATDVGIEDLLVDPLAFENTVVPITVKVRAYGAKGRTLQVRLLVEDRAGKKPGESGEMVVAPSARGTHPSAEVEVGRDSDLRDVQLSFMPTQSGEFKIAVEVATLDGELRLGNNSSSTIVTVRKGGVMIAYFDVVRPEQKFLRMIGRDRRFQLDFMPIRRGPDGGPSPLDPKLFDPDAYDAYIIGDLPAETFGRDLLQKLRQRVDEGAGLLMTGGAHTYAAGGYDRSPLAEILPVAMRPENPAAAEPESIAMRPTRQGLAHYLMRIDSEADTMRRWLSLAEMSGANALEPKNRGVQVLAEGADGRPLLLAHEVPARVAALAVDTTWQWAMAGDHEAHQRFWRQMMLWLTRKELEGDQPVWARAEPRTVAAGQRVGVTFGAQSAEGEAVPDADFEVEVRSPAGKGAMLNPRRTGDFGAADFGETDAAGDYWVRVSATRSGTPLGPDAWTRWVVDERDLELDNPAADRSLMQAIAEETAGTAIAPEDLGRYLERLISDPSTDATLEAVHSYPLWDNWGFLGVFVAVMSIEWFLRKKRGLV